MKLGIGGLGIRVVGGAWEAGEVGEAALKDTASHKGAEGAEGAGQRACPHVAEGVNMKHLSQELVNGVAQLFPDAIFYHKTTEKVVALTIDDAPCRADKGDCGTKLILDAIAAHNQKYGHLEPAKATFFIISSHLSPNSQIIAEIMAQGHEIANHGVIDETHALLTPQQFAQQLKEAHQKLLELTGSDIRWYRPGRGFYNQTMLKAITDLTAEENYDLQLVLASMIPFDTFEITNNPWLTAMYTKQMIFPGAILVFHANSIKVANNTAIALKTILENLRQRGYRIVTVSELLGN